MPEELDENEISSEPEIFPYADNVLLLHAGPHRKEIALHLLQPLYGPDDILNKVQAYLEAAPVLRSFSSRPVS